MTSPTDVSDNAKPLVRESAAEAVKPGHFRYVVLGMIFAITVINYADRATLSIAGTEVSRVLSLDPVMLGMVFSAFAWAYMIGQIPGGWLLDKFGARRVYGCSLILWSVFTMLQGTVGWFGVSGISAAIMLFFLRFMLGLVESPAFPANARIVACWFPTNERGTATSLFNSAQYMAIGVFTPIMAWLTHALGWEHVFLWMGAVGLFAGILWFAFYKEPHSSPHIKPAELEHIRANGALVDLELNRRASRQKFTFREVMQLFQSRTLWGIYIGQYCITSMSYFFMTWFPIYLIKGRGMTVMQAGWVVALPAICGFTGGVLGGVMSDYMIRRGVSPSKARKTPFVLGMFFAAMLAMANFVSTDAAVIALMTLAFFGKGLSAIGWAVMSDTAPEKMIGLSGGVFNCLGNVAGIITPVVIGYIVAATGSFNFALWFVGAHGLLGMFGYLVVAGKFERMVIRPDDRENENCS